jgi:hypothetical protein
MNTFNFPQRVHYYDRQYLRRQDFSDEQSYQIALRRRHNISAHSWGIVAGLEIAQEEGVLGIRPGLAIDGYGRELLLAGRYPIAVEEFQRLGSNRLDVWLNYETRNAAMPPKGYGACDGNAEDEFYRTQEQPRVSLERAGISRIDARRPKQVPKVILDSPSQLETPDDPLTLWPLYLGRITLTPEEQDPAKRFLIDATDRPYAGVAGEVVDHPGNAARVEIGRQSKSEDQRVVGDVTYTYSANDQRAFGVFVAPDASAAGSTEVDLEPRFEIDTDGTNYLRGTATVYGNLQIAGGAVQFTKPVDANDDATREFPSLYRAKTSKSDELRIDLGSLSNQPSLAIGFTADDGSFKQAMKLEFPIPAAGLKPQPLLTIYGDLTMNGLLKSADEIARSLSSDALTALLASFQTGVVAASKKS